MAGVSDDRPGFRLSAIQVAAGAAAAATAAFAASALGVAGTILGAALVSATITVLAAVYDHSMRQARTRLLEARLAERARAGGVTSSARPPEDPLAHDDDTTTLVLPALDLEGSDGYHWRRIAVVSLLLFALVMGAITAFELVTGRPISTLFTGGDSTGTTISNVVRRPQRPESYTPTPTTTPTTTPPSTPTVTRTVTPTPTVTFTHTATPTSSTSPTSTGTASPFTGTAPPTP